MISYYLRLIFAYIRRHWNYFLWGFIAGTAAVLFIIFIWPRLPKPLPTIHRGINGNFTITNLPKEVQNKISFGLTEVSDKYEATEEGKVWFFHLQPGAIWQDGKPLTAADINYQLADVKITPVDERTVRFDLATPFAPLPSVVSQPLFRPGLVGLGRFRVKNIKMAGRFLREITVSDGLKNLHYKFYPTEEILKTAFKLGDVDEIVVGDFASLESFKIKRSVDYQKQAIAFFNTKNGPLADKNFRQGLLYALSDLPEYGSPSAGPIPPTSWAYNDKLKKYPLNLDLAKKLIAKEAASFSGKLKLSATANLLPTGNKLKNFWEQIGLTIETETAEIIPQNFDIYLTEVEIPNDPDQYQLWHSTSPLNTSAYRSPKSDKFLEEGRQEIDLEVRKQIYANWQRAITEDAPAAFLYFPFVYTISRR